MSAVPLQNIFSAASRDKCMAKLKSLVSVPPRSGKAPENNSALILPLCRVDGVPSLLYTVRSSNFRMNTGLITFPGGKIKQGETAEQTVMREVGEDLGLATEKINIWGKGPAFKHRDKNDFIIPVIGVVPELTASDLNINMDKVVEAFTIPLEILCDPKNQFYTHFSNGHVLPVFMAENYKICGTTAYITHVFLSAALPKEVYGNEWLRSKLEKSVE